MREIGHEILDHVLEYVIDGDNIVAIDALIGGDGSTLLGGDGSELLGGDM